MAQYRLFSAVDRVTIPSRDVSFMNEPFTVTESFKRPVIETITLCDPIVHMTRRISVVVISVRMPGPFNNRSHCRCRRVFQTSRNLKFELWTGWMLDEFKPYCNLL